MHYFTQLLEISYESYFHNRYLIFINILVIFCMISNYNKSNNIAQTNKKIKKYQDIVFIILNSFLFLYLSLYILFECLNAILVKTSPNYNLLQWLFVPFTFETNSNSIYDYTTRMMYEESKSNRLEFTIRVYISVFIISLLLTIYKKLVAYKNPFVDLIIYFILASFVALLILLSIKYIDVFTSVILIPMFISLLLLIIDRLFILSIRSPGLLNNKKKNETLVKHKDNISFFKDIVYGVTCQSTHTYKLNINANVVCILILLILLLNISVKVYYIQK